MSADGREQLEAHLSAYLDGELTPAERAEVEAFLAADPQARALLDELRATVRAVHSLPRATASDDLADAIRSRLERRALLGDGPIPGDRTGRTISVGTRWVAAAAVVFMTSVAGYVMWSFRDQPEPGSPKHEELAWNDRVPAAPPERLEAVDRLESKDKKRSAPQPGAAGTKAPMSDDRASRSDWLDGTDTGHAQPVERVPLAPSGVTATPRLSVPADEAAPSAELGLSDRRLSVPATVPPPPPAAPLVTGDEFRSLDETTFDAKHDNELFLARKSAETEGRSASGTVTQKGAAMDWSATLTRPEYPPAAVARSELHSRAEGEAPAPPQVVELVYADADRQRQAVELLRSQFSFRVAGEPDIRHFGGAATVHEKLGEVTREEASIAEQPRDALYGYQALPAAGETRRVRGRETPVTQREGSLVGSAAGAPAAAVDSSQAEDLGKGTRTAGTKEEGDRDGLLVERGGDFLWSRPAGGVTVMEIDLPDEQAVRGLLANVEQSQAGNAVIMRTLDVEPSSTPKPAAAPAKGERFSYYYAEGLGRAARSLGEIASRYAQRGRALSIRAPAKDAATAPAEDDDSVQGASGRASGPESRPESGGLAAGLGGFGAGGSGGVRAFGQATSAPAANVPGTLPAEPDGDSAEHFAGLYAGEPLPAHVIHLYFHVEPPATRPADAAAQPPSRPSP